MTIELAVGAVVGILIGLFIRPLLDAWVLFHQARRYEKRERSDRDDLIRFKEDLTWRT